MTHSFLREQLKSHHSIVLTGKARETVLCSDGLLALLDRAHLPGRKVFGNAVVTAEGRGRKRRREKEKKGGRKKKNTSSMMRSNAI